MSPELSPYAARQYVVAARLLECYVGVGYVPDIVECVAGIRDVLPIDQLTGRVELLEERARPFERLIQRPRPVGDMSSQVLVESQDSQSGSRAERAGLVIAMTDEFLLVPLARLYRLVRENVSANGRAWRQGLFDDNAYTRATATSRLSYRWYLKGDAEVEARLMARDLNLSATAVLDVLDGLARRRRRLGGPDGWLHFEGIIDTSDVRVTGGSGGLAEVAIRCESSQVGLQVLENLIEMVGLAAAREVYSVREVVAGRLLELRSTG